MWQFLRPQGWLFIRFFLYGMMVCAGIFLLQFFWLDVVAALLGQSLIVYDQQPGWSKLLIRLIALSPWLGALFLLIGDWRRGNISRALAFATGQILIYMAVFFYLFLWPYWKDYFNHQAFDSNQWKTSMTQHVDEIPIRQYMVDDLMRRYTLIGLSSQELEELLGLPSQKTQNQPPPLQYYYWLGPERGFLGFDSEFLVITIENNRVTAVRRETH
ncbi:MAG TPA: hypothetical protein PKC68_08160 [Alphaproteobacteria bacterium]|nr:hypothetical protein [Alphaproteobacteria bacterium]